MIQITQLKLECSHTEEAMEKKLLHILRIKREQLLSYEIRKHSIDARKKPILFDIYTVFAKVEDEEKFVKRLNHPQVTLVTEEAYSFPKVGNKELIHRPVIIGAGPAGLFCAYFLSLHGYRPILLERGEDVDTRTKKVQAYWEGNDTLSEESNVQFGEGGAGTFSDGKLNTLNKDRDGRNRKVLEVFAAHGASERILYENKPHIGTDVLRDVVKNMRAAIEMQGGEVRFQSKVTDLMLEGDNIKGLCLKDNENLDAQVVVLAIGHSARDTFQMLLEKKVPMESKSFAVGLRVEHPQSLINQSQYGNHSYGDIPNADYKLTAQVLDSDGEKRGVYSFCMCPGGYVVNASSEKEGLCINGMSYEKRDSDRANSAIIVSVTPKDFETEGALAGVAFQRKLEKAAYACASGNIPVQLLGHFKKKQVSKKEDFQYDPCLKGAYEYADVSSILPEKLNQAFLNGMQAFGKKVTNFDADWVVVSGVEARTSSPVRILRNEELESVIKGLYPCGEGAGYAGGITSAAMDGMKAAEAIAKCYQPFKN